MATLIRMPGETDAEYQRRCGPLFALAASPMFHSQLLKIVEHRNVLAQYLRVAKLRQACGVEANRGDVFTWDIGT